MDFFKALIPGALLTWVVSAVLHKGHSTGGYLHIEQVTVKGMTFSWSWTLFIVATGLCWALFAMAPKND